MEFLHEMDEYYFKIAFLIVCAIGYLIVQRRKDFKLTLQYLLYSYGIAILLLSITIPHVFSGYPYEVADLENKKRLLYHLQRNNEELVQTTEAIREMVFITFIFLISIISKIIKHFKLEKPVQ